jgi:flagellin-like hook-associated protein FlgL
VGEVAVGDAPAATGAAAFTSVTAAVGSTLSGTTEFDAATTLYEMGDTMVLGNVTLGANVDNTQMNLIKNNSVLAQGTKMTLVSGGSLNVGVTTKEIDDNVPAGATLTLAEAATSAQVSDVKQGSILAEGSTINMANNYAVELNGISITKTNHGAANATITFGAASGLDPILLASLDDKGKDVRIGNTMINVSRDGVITLKGGSAEVSAAAGLATTTVTGGFTAAAGSVLAGGSVIDTSVTAREDWTINYNAGVMTMSDNLNNNNVEIAVGATLTLDNGTVIRNNGGGEFELLSGSLITGNDLELGTDVSAFNIAAQSTIAGGSMSGLDTVTLVHSSNYRIADAGTLSNNVTIGNGVNMSNSDVTHLTAGTVLSVGSDISVADGRFIMLEVAGKEVQVSWDAANSTLKVGDEVVAAGKSITLEDGSIITNQGKFASQTQGEGMISVTSGSIKLARDISTDIGNVTGYNIAKDSTLAAGSSVAAGVSFNAGTVITAGGSTPFSGSITLAHEGKGVQFSANTSNSLSTNIFEAKTGESLTFVFTQYEAASSKLADSLMSQIGANSGQTSFLSMGDMRAKALGVDRIDISSKFGAATAIETVNNALQKVSHQRSLLGAVQNRLEHTIKNLDTAAENLQSAESRIRDVDMAREIMEHTKNNILQQASQAMLAQANQQPQSVLQLLR